MGLTDNSSMVQAPRFIYEANPKSEILKPLDLSVGSIQNLKADESVVLKDFSLRSFLASYSFKTSKIQNRLTAWWQLRLILGTESI